MKYMNCNLISYKSIRKLFLCFFVTCLLGVVNYKTAYATSGQTPFRYYEDKFEMYVPALPTKYNNLTHNLEDAVVELLEDKVVISELVPDQVYNGVVINFTDDLGRKYDLKFDNVITSQPTKPHNKFIYSAYENGLGRKPDHKGFKFWYKKLKDFEITSVGFILEMVNSNEFNTNYKTSEEKIKALYKTIVGREADEEGFRYWESEFLNLINEGLEDRQAIIEITKRMVLSDEFKSNVEKTGFQYN